MAKTESEVGCDTRAHVQRASLILCMSSLLAPTRHQSSMRETQEFLLPCFDIVLLLFSVQKARFFSPRLSTHVLRPQPLILHLAETGISGLVLPQPAHQSHAFVVVTRHTGRRQNSGRDHSQALPRLPDRGPAQLVPTRVHEGETGITGGKPRLADVRESTGLAAARTAGPQAVKVFDEAAQRGGGRRVRRVAAAVQLHLRPACGLERDDRTGTVRNHEGAQRRPQGGFACGHISRRGPPLARKGAGERGAVEGQQKQRGDDGGGEKPEKAGAGVFETV